MIAFTNAENAGFLPTFFNEDDPRSAVEQLDEAYQHGGGVSPLQNTTVFNSEKEGDSRLVFTFPVYGGGDEVESYEEISRGTMRDQTIILYDYDFVAIIGPKPEDLVVCRVD